ncbi:MAG: transforming growth factor-beta-induced protein [Candidatus Aldehydirespiratoraceae bacterium]|jgi:transforming growth factor-beta-induced protein
MSKRFLRLLSALLAFSLLAAACGDDDEVDSSDTTTTEAPDDDMADEDMAAEPGTIVDVAVANDFTTLVAAVQAAGLVETLSGEGPFTVFAPTDEAFAAALESLGLTAEELLASDDLASILTYHVVAGEVDAATAISLDGQSAVTVNGAEINISVVDGSVVINDTATVIAADVEASNGIVHVIDAVLLPPADDMAEDDDMAEEEAAEPGTIVDVAVANDFTTLVAAVQAAGLVETLSGEGPFTVFAPTDEAFAAALESLGLTAEELLASDDLASILTYHVVAGEVDAATAISLDGQSAVTVNGAEINISVVDGSVVINDTATVIAADVEASNGIVHVIDAVLLPPA